ncbi:hypothetical protein AB205_0142950 [Aquarana catesbeiana]|uniref:RRM domain-containing protein n=1 Tax=Aquarana catesbeiana TaxID=8400 RepID=A0A2G9SL01_AQUCT|nr:hypothetical protein AB205_0142950 [Aquarana catesbeiana]
MSKEGAEQRAVTDSLQLSAWGALKTERWVVFDRSVLSVEAPEDRYSIGPILHPPRKLFVGGLDWSTTQETLRTYFSQYGEVVDCVIMKDKTTNQSRGFGFVKFKDPNCVGTVLASRPHTLDGRNIDPKPCTPRGMQPERSRSREEWQPKSPRTESNKSNKVFVGGIPHNCGEAELRDYFKRFGVVTEVVMIYDAEKQRPRGVLSSITQVQANLVR